MKTESRTNSQNFAKIGKASLNLANKAGQSEEFKQGVASLAQNAPEGSHQAKFLDGASKGLSLISVATKIYGLVKPLTVATK